ncbi:glycoside hydrolase family 57 protein [Ignavibacteria bacterium]|nr:glycoside hydrolase [Bacteroidota bacterium]MCZ2133223.1 glycoside hydrolase [Bacteroidota bacterium]
MPLPLKVALLWHQHQPYYKKNDEFILPWVRMHGAKDYYDLPALAVDFPSLKQTFNLAPSLVMQLADYAGGTASDTVQRLSLTPAEMLTVAEKHEILRLFFLCNGECMIVPYERYRELWNRAENTADAVAEFTVQDWRDVQAWYNLTWIGQSGRRDERIAALFEKGRNFSESNITAILDVHRQIIESVIPVMRRLRDGKQIEISVTPLYHPIVPLLIDSRAALEAMECELPSPPFAYPEDATAHIKRGIELYGEYFDDTPAGMWFSEGGISDAALELAIKSGIRWTASDEDALWASLPAERHWTDKYFPRKFVSEAGVLGVLFRDHALSDAVGFVYSRWQADHAADDFCGRLRHIREAIIERHGESALAHAVVPVILDGENCWEYFYRNGEPFLRELYKRLTGSPELITVTCDEATVPEHLEFAPELRHIRAGSWINANFKIWIGHREDNAAWSLLRAARETVEKRLPELQPETAQKALEHCYIAEGSDWFWWYGDEHVSENQAEFDELFRWNLAEAYRHAQVEPPPEVFTPICSNTQHNISPPANYISPVLSGNAESKGWDQAGYFELSHTTGTMHAANELLHRVRYGADEKTVFFRFEFARPLHTSEKITVQSRRTREAALTFGIGQMALNVSGGELRSELHCAIAEAAEVAVSREVFGEVSESLEIMIIIATETGTMTFPRSGTMKLPLFMGKQ